MTTLLGPSSRHILAAGAAAGAVALSGSRAGVPSAMGGSGRAVRGFRPLVPDAAGCVDLPAGFTYRLLSTVGDARAIVGPWERRCDAPQAA